MLHDLVDCMYVLCCMIYFTVMLRCMIWLTVCAMLHDLVDCMHVLCCMIWLTVCAVWRALANCKCYVT